MNSDFRKIYNYCSITKPVIEKYEDLSWKVMEIGSDWEKEKMLIGAKGTDDIPQDTEGEEGEDVTWQPENGNSVESNGVKKSTDPPRNYLGVLPFAVIVFYNVSGGPFGIEPTVRAAGPLYSIIGFIFFILVWSVPEALVTAELGATYPHASGGVAWVEEAFGRKASGVMGYISWISGATDNAIYPALFLSYLRQILSAKNADDGGDDAGRTAEDVIFLIVCSTILTCINYFGLEIVGNMSIIIAIISMSPFVIMCAVGIFKIQPHRWLVPSSPDAGIYQFDDDAAGEGDSIPPGLFVLPNLLNIVWRPFLNNLFWNVNSFDAGANLSKEVRDLKTVYADGMKLSILFVAVSYILPLLVATGAAETKQEDWVSGYLATVAIEIVGPWLGGWMVVAAGISNISLFMAELSADSYQIMGMAERGLVPKIFTHRSRFGTPTYGILLCWLVIVFMSFSNFNELIQMMNFNYTLSLFMEYAAFIKLRMRDDKRSQPYRIPLNTFGCILFITPAIVSMLVILLASSYKTFVYCVGFLMLGAIGYWFQTLCRHKNWIEYVECEEGIDYGHTPNDLDFTSVEQREDDEDADIQLHDERPQIV